MIETMRYLALIAVIPLIMSCDERQEPTGPSRVGVLVSGTVLSFVSGAAVSGATIAYGSAIAVTDDAGSYSLTVPAIGWYEPLVDGARMGSIRVTGASYRGDFLARPGTCVSRYGVITNSRRLHPIAGARVSLLGSSVLSATDGWYRIDFGCPSTGLVGSNTTFIHVSHPSYVDRSAGVGRGVFGVARLDLELQRR